MTARKRFEPGQAVEVRERPDDCWSSAEYIKSTNSDHWHHVKLASGRSIPVPARRIRPRKTERR